MSEVGKKIAAAWKALTHRHKWQHHSTRETPNVEWQEDGVTYYLLSRRIYYKVCYGCGRVEQYYPDKEPTT